MNYSINSSFQHIWIFVTRSAEQGCVRHAWEISGIGIPGTWRFRFWKVTACDNFKGIPKWALTDNICNTKFLLLYCSKTKSMIPAYRKFRNKGMTEKLIPSIYQYWIQCRYFSIYRRGNTKQPWCNSTVIIIFYLCQCQLDLHLECRTLIKSNVAK
jgi:hypothetical protein